MTWYGGRWAESALDEYSGMIHVRYEAAGVGPRRIIWVAYSEYYPSRVRSPFSCSDEVWSASSLLQGLAVVGSGWFTISGPAEWISLDRMLLEYDRG